MLRAFSKLSFRGVSAFVTRCRHGLRLLAGFVLLATSATAQAPVNRIPEVHSTDLTGRPVNLPAMLQQKAGVLVVGFSRESREQATAWGTRLAGDFNSSSEVSFYELPVLDDVPRLLRGVVLRAIAKDVADPGKPHFVPLTGNQEQWKAVTHFEDSRDAYVLVVDGKGTVRWQVAGEPTDENYRAMRRALTTVMGKSG